jgi:hypothetical protein
MLRNHFAPGIDSVRAIRAVGGPLWAPRIYGPIDLRWDGASYYVLGTSLAEGRLSPTE